MEAHHVGVDHLIAFHVIPQIFVGHVVGHVVEVVAAVHRVVVGGAEAHAVPRVHPVAVGVLQIGTDVQVHGGHAVGHHHDEVVLAGTFYGGLVVVASIDVVVHDGFHGLAQLGVGIGHHLADRRGQGHRVVPLAVSQDVAAVAVGEEHRQAEIQPLGAIDQISKNHLQVLDAGYAGNSVALLVRCVLVDPVQIVAGVQAVLGRIRSDEIGQRGSRPGNVEVHGCPKSVRSYVIGRIRGEFTGVDRIRIVARMIDRRVHGSGVVDQEHQVGPEQILLDGERHLANLVRGIRWVIATDPGAGLAYGNHWEKGAESQDDQHRREQPRNVLTHFDTFHCSSISLLCPRGSGQVIPSGFRD